MAMKRPINALLFGALLFFNGTHSEQTKDSFPDDLIGRYMAENHVPGLAYAVVRSDGISLSGAYGLANVEKNIPMGIHSIMNIGSISKTITATAIMQLWEKGQIELDADINDYLPFTVKNPHFPDIPITTRQLLTHTSSIQDGPAYTESYACGDPEVSLKDWITGYLVRVGAYYDEAENFLLKKPGEAHHYSNVGYGLLGYIVEEVTDLPFYSYCREKIFEPLGMVHSAWFLREINTADHALPYFYVSTESLEAINRHFNQLLHDDRFLTPGGYMAPCLYSFPNYPDGLLRTSVVELSYFLDAFIHSGKLDHLRILKRSTVEKMLSLQLEDDDSQGLCWHKTQFESLWGHGGADPGVQTKMFFSPQTKIGVIIFQNSNGGDQFELVKKLYISAKNGRSPGHAPSTNLK
jgi:CubicO group peptidase (beta-lactamase class C family)